MTAAARALRSLAPTWAATAAVAVLLLAPVPAPPAAGVSALFGVPHVDKLVHLLLFLALGWIWHRSLARAGRPVPYLAVFAAAVAYGAFLEALQHLSGVRTAEWGDVAADALGAGLVPLWRPWPQAGRRGGAAEPGGDTAAGTELAPGPADSR